MPLFMASPVEQPTLGTPVLRSGSAGPLTESPRGCGKRGDGCEPPQDAGDLSEGPWRHDICGTTGRALSRHTGYDANLTRAFLEACATTCKACGDECGSHADMHEHCRVCAEACRRSEQACRDLIDSLG